MRAGAETLYGDWVVIGRCVWVGVWVGYGWCMDWLVSTPTPPTNISLLSDGRHGKNLVWWLGGYYIPGINSGYQVWYRSVDVASEKHNQHTTNNNKCQKDNPQPKATRYQVCSASINGWNTIGTLFWLFPNTSTIKNINKSSANFNRSHSFLCE